MNLSSLCWEGNHRFWKKDKIFQQKKRLKIKESCGFEEKKLQMFGVLVKCLSLENLEFERLHSKSFERLVGNFPKSSFNNKSLTHLFKKGKTTNFCLGGEELEWYDLKKFVYVLTKKKEISFERYDRKKYHIFVIILVFPKENQIVFVGGEIWVVEFVK